MMPSAAAPARDIDLVMKKRNSEHHYRSPSHWNQGFFCFCWQQQERNSI